MSYLSFVVSLSNHHYWKVQKSGVKPVLSEKKKGRPDQIRASPY